jgi:SAM-dependent methyltransferase
MAQPLLNHSKPTARAVACDWYDTPLYYDIVFAKDTELEADFLEEVMRRHGDAWHEESLRVLEPACGSGRLMEAMARRGHRVWGFDLNPNMVSHTRERLRKDGDAVVCWQDKMEDFTVEGTPTFDLAHCLVSTFKYVLSEKGAVSHLQHVSQCLHAGGLYVLGIHLTDYTDAREQHERWVGDRDGVHVVCNTHTWPADRRARTEKLRTRLRITREGKRVMQETQWTFRTYNAAEVKRLLRAVPQLELMACYDFTYDLNQLRKLDDQYADIVLVLRRR